MCQACGAEHSAPDGKCPECGATETIRLRTAPADRMIGKVIKGKYKILLKLGQGGMGAVYLAEQMGIGHRVALKFLKSEFSSDTEIARRFLNEAKSYARVAHPNAVTLHDFGQDEDGNLFIAMEYCEGTDLKKVISEQGHLPVVEAVEVVLQVADVLANAHSKGVVHRDLKPENIMIRRGMRGVHAKVLDFGIARLMDAGTRLTVAGAIAGTPRYMSPEQVEGREADLRADVYSLGIVLYESLTGVQPFDGNTIAEILRRQVAEPMPKLSDAIPGVELVELDAVIQKATAKNRDERWPDMLAFAGALSQALPTQSQLSVPALQRSGLSRINATPSPGVVPGFATSGEAMTEEEMTGSTMLKPATIPPPSGPRRPPNLTHQSSPTIQHGLASTLEGRLDAAPVVPTPAQKSKSPVIAAVIVIAGLLGAALWLFNGRTIEPAEKPVTVLTPPTVEPVHEPAVEPSNQGHEIAELVKKEIQETGSRTRLAAARASFEKADLDAAEVDLRAVDENTGASKAAKELLETIKRIRQRLSAANGFRNHGDCPRALPLYKEVLSLNSRITAASAGAESCKAAMIDQTMDP